MNNKRRKTRELFRLSAYLDNALPARKKQKLEARLAVDPELQKKLDNLRRTKLALSLLQRMQAPRNFTLTPDMVPERKPRVQPIQTALRLASALAAILLVVTFGAEFILGTIRPSQELAADMPVMMEAARAPEESTPEPLIQWGPPNAQGEVYGMGGDSFAMEEPRLEMESMPEEEAAPEIEQEMAEESPDPAEPAAAKGSDLILGINADEAGEIVNRSAPAIAQPETEPMQGLDTFNWVQIGLAVIAVGGGMALLILRRQRHP